MRTKGKTKAAKVINKVRRMKGTEGSECSLIAQFSFIGIQGKGGGGMAGGGRADGER